MKNPITGDAIANGFALVARQVRAFLKRDDADPGEEIDIYAAKPADLCCHRSGHLLCETNLRETMSEDSEEHIAFGKPLSRGLS